MQAGVNYGNLKKEVIRLKSIKKEAITLLQQMPDKLTWDDVMYEVYIMKKLEKSIKASKEGKVVPHEEVKKRFLK